jgi:hypothetical protein
MSNFEYILLLNRISGRTVHDFAHYPLFPWLGNGRLLNLTIDRTAKYDRPPMTDSVASTFAVPAQVDFAALRGQGGVEAVPELYAMPAFSSLENVYRQRKLLESREVSLELHTWMTLIWSADLAVHVSPLFRGIHPRRDGSPEAPPFRSAVVVHIREKVDFALVTSDEHGFTVRYLSIARALTGGVTFPHRSPDRPVTLAPAAVALPALRDPVFRDLDGRAAFFEARSTALHVLDAHGVRSLPTRAPITAVASSGRWLLVGGDDSSLVLYRDLRAVWSALLYREAVVACAIGGACGAAVAGLRDGAVVVCALANAAVAHVAAIAPQTPRAILVTPAWGLVVLYATDVVPGSLRHWLCVMAPDGALAARVEIPFRVCAWCAWHSRAGFDFIACTDDSGAILIAEAMELEQITQIYRAANRIVRLEFVPRAQAIVAVSDAGSVIVIPFNSGG